MAKNHEYDTIQNKNPAMEEFLFDINKDLLQKSDGALFIDNFNNNKDFLHLKTKLYAIWNRNVDFHRQTSSFFD